MTAAHADDEAWKVEDVHGAVHSVNLDLNEGTWMNLSVHGDRIVFDLLGDIWTVPLAGGEATRLTIGAAWDGQPSFSPDGSQIAFVSDAGGNENLWLMSSDGTNAEALTEDKVARITHPSWDPSGRWVVGRRRTVDTRSIGVTELWQYHVDGGDGIGLTKLDSHPHAGEQVVTEEHIWFSNRYGRFNYNQNPVSGLWEVVRLNRETGETRSYAHGAGSASRPILTPDHAELWFVSRDRTRTQLEAVELDTGERRVVADWLSPDEMEGFALHATYPRMDWTDEGDLVLWAQGKLWRLSPDGERTEIEFQASGEWTLHDVPRWQRPISDTVRAKVLRWPTLSTRGWLAFSALGSVWLADPEDALSQLSDSTGYAPTWSPNGEDLLYTTWSDNDGGRLVLHPGKGKPEELPIDGQLVNPAWDEAGERIVVLRGVGRSTSPDLGAVGWFDIMLLTPDKKGWTVDKVTSIGNRGATRRAPRLHFHDDRVWFMEGKRDAPRTPETVHLVSFALDGKDKRDHMTLGGAEEVAISPDFQWVAYRLGHQLHVAAFPRVHKAVDKDAVPNAQVTKIVGDWIGFTPDSKHVTWMEGPVLKQLSLETLFEEAEEDEEGAREDDVDAEEEDALADPEGTVAREIVLEMPRSRPDRVLALTHARVITMEGDEVLEDTTVVIDGDRIVSIGGAVPDDAEVIDCTGKTLVPGLIDVHAHLHFASGDVLPEQEWRYQTALDFGVTTVQDPSASTDLVFTQAEMVRAGRMIGPRVYSTGYVLYGALGNLNAETPDEDAARAHVRRLKAVGADSVKVYQQSQRERRQWYVQACNEEQILCVPEGGGDLWMNLGMVADGFHAIEHSLSTSPLHDDVIGFFGATATDDTFGTAYSQTLSVAYGGVSGKYWFYQHRDPHDDERLLRHTPRRDLDREFWRGYISARDGDWRHQQVAASAAELADAGVMLSLGAHGELQGLGVHWELWSMAGPDALSPHDALRAATLNGARYMGLDDELGSLKAGKFADIIVLNSNPLDDIENSVDIDFVVKNGEIHE